MSISDIPLFNLFDPIKPSGYLKISEHNYLRNGLPGETEEQYVDRCVDELEKCILKMDQIILLHFVVKQCWFTTGRCPPSPGYWRKCKDICDKYNIHLILDEIYCGMGRSGKVFCCSYDEVIPDFICIGKGAAGGYARFCCNH